MDRKKDKQRYLEIVKENAKKIREEVLQYLMIRRTRNEIIRYYGEDLKAHGLQFPKVADPQPLFYQFNKKENEIFHETLRALTQDLTYCRYNPLEYYRERKTHEQEIQRQRNLSEIMKILLIKRLESSFHAFGLMLQRFLHSYTQVIQQFQNGYVYISKKYIGNIFDLCEANDEEGIEELLSSQKAERFDAKDFDPQFMYDLENDQRILQRLDDLWKEVHRDPKWEKLSEVLRTDSRLQNKVILFTESKETAEYLTRNIQEKVEPRVLLFTGSSNESTRKLVISNFDARAFSHEDKYRILVTTEVLSEGMNLHRSNVVINYDIPWNPTRLMQRVGRVNRLDTPFDIIHTFNFFPTEESNDVIKLKESAQSKIESFIEMLGTDARLLTQDEEIKSHDLFAKLNSSKTITGEDEEEESKLQYLTEIREVRDKQPDLFAKIQKIPLHARSTKLVLPEQVTTPGKDSGYAMRRKLDENLVYSLFESKFEISFIFHLLLSSLKQNIKLFSMHIEVWHCDFVGWIAFPYWWESGDGV